VVLGAAADEIRKQISFTRERVVVNPDYALGGSTSIQAGLRAIAGEAALIVLADQPSVRPETIELLIETYERRRPKIVIPTYAGKRGNPVVIDRSLFDAMMKIRGDVGFRAVFGEYAEGIVSVPVSDQGVVTDVDTADDLGSLT
jgi:molybdenum cofactor cytidylyltransferase